MARKFWDADAPDYKAKLDFLRDYTLRNGRERKFDLREVQIQKLADLTMEIVPDVAVTYFETLPSNYKTAFKNAWRQKQHKAKLSAFDYKTMELTSEAAGIIDHLVSKLDKEFPQFQNHSLQVRRELALRYVSICAVVSENDIAREVFVEEAGSHLKELK